MLSLDEKRTLLAAARSAIEAKFLKKHPPLGVVKSPSLIEKKGAFVTLTVEGNLRGCIGRVEPQTPLFETVSEMAVSAAFQDPRFPPLTLPELSRCVLEISVLSALKRLSDLRELEVGKQGLMVRRGFSSGLLLPQVAAHNRWSAEEFFGQGCLKAGIPIDAWRKPETELFTFTAEVFSEEDV